MLTVKSTPSRSFMGGSEIHPLDEAEISGDYDVPSLTDKSLSSVLVAPAPSFRLVFKCSDNAKLIDCTDTFAAEPPTALQEAIGDFWKASLTYRYKAYMRKDASRESYLALLRSYDQDCNDFEKRAQNIEITTFRGTRYITRVETGHILFFVNTQADRVIAKTQEMFEVK
jgi:hypothetical protein